MVLIGGLEFDMEQCDRIHSTREKEFFPIVQELFDHAQIVDTPDKRLLIYVNNGADILGVAHLDATMKATHFFHGWDYKNEDYVVMSPFVDDRLGAFTLLKLLPQVDIPCDLLFTIDEESGRSTGGLFLPEKKYNWMFQFDRKGTDAVHYQYTKEEWLEALRKHFDKVLVGAASDICKMGHVGCQGVNIGTGYYDYTDIGAWASMNDLCDQVQKFKKFHDEFKETAFTHIKGEYAESYRTGRYVEDEHDNIPARKGGGKLVVRDLGKKKNGTKAAHLHNKQTGNNDSAQTAVVDSIIESAVKG